MGILEDLRDARSRTLELALDLDDDQWRGPRLAIVNPLSWELGHLAWFQEYWTLRHRSGAPSIRSDADRLYDSARVAHDSRWDLPLPDRNETLLYLAETLERSLRSEQAAADPYFHRLALFHEDMHDEALTYTRQTLGYPAPKLALVARNVLGAGPLPGDAEIPGARYLLGAIENESFVFDNEKWAHPVDVIAFRIARAPVTNEEFLRFVRAGGYEKPELWSDEGWAWRDRNDARHPVYWKRAESGEFRVRRYDAWELLAPHQPMVHVCFFEADAYCRWAKRRLPTESEWELAASGHEKRNLPWGNEAPCDDHANLDGRHGGPADVGALAAGDSEFGCRQMIGNVWEWTASEFVPYPGFVIDPYQEYSEPWFRSPHKVLRGGCWATRARLIRNTWRNFYPPDRRDVIAGFRTCAL